MVESQPGCPPIDLGFLLDSSGSLNQGDNERLIQEFTKSVVDNFELGPDGTHVGLVQFDNTATTLLRFTDTQTKANVEDKINTYEIRRGQTFINKGIDEAYNELFDEGKGMRGSNFKKVSMKNCAFGFNLLGSAASKE